MYSTCLFCNTSLGTNESIELFPVGRRLAYDAAKGRLWVVCRKCERWNLSPLESRWEAIEQAERVFRSTKLRVSTDNIGMAQLKDGTQLVRIGAPPKLEFAAWRYGNQFGTRQRRFFARATIVGVGSVVITNIATIPTLTMGVPFRALMGAGASFAFFGAYVAMTMKRSHVPHASIRDQQGVLRRFSIFNAQRAMLGPAGHAFEWQLSLPYQDVTRAGRVFRALGIKEIGRTNENVVLRDAAAIHALSKILPHANTMGGGRRAVKNAVEVVEDAPNLHYLLHKASVVTPLHNLAPVPRGEVAISAMPTAMRLALEMSIHENDERRAMEGELHLLEQRWKEADEIAKIADEMFLPQNVESTLNALHDPQNKTGSSE